MSQHAMASPKHSLCFSASGLPFILVPETLPLFHNPPQNVFKTAVTGNSLQAPQGWDQQRLSLVQIQGKGSLSDEVWTHVLSLALLFKLCASKGQDLKEL